MFNTRQHLTLLLVMIACFYSSRTAFAQRSAMPGSPRWSPDGQKVAFDAYVSEAPNERSAIFVINADGTGLTRLSGPNDDDGSPDWSPDGTKIAFGSQGDIWVMNPDGSGRTRLTTAASHEWAPVWSPDGTKIACLTDRNDATSIIIINSATGEEIRYVSASSQEPSFRPSWSPDGNRLLFQRGGFLWLRDLTTFALTQLTTGDENTGDREPAWSPDGTHILFSTTRFGDKLAIINADGSGLRRVTTEQEPDDFTGISELSPAWSPDGTKIVYVREYNYKDPEDPDHREDQQLYIVNVDGTGQRQLTSLYLVKAGKAGKGFLVQNKGKTVEPAKPSPHKETPAPRKEQSAPTPPKIAAVSTRPTPQERARLRGKVERATKVGGGVALGVFLVWVLVYRHRFKEKSPLDTSI